MGETKRLFSSNILPLNYNEKYLGYLLEDKLKIEYLSKIIKKIMQTMSGYPELSSASPNSQTSGVGLGLLYLPKCFPPLLGVAVRRRNRRSSRRKLNQEIC